MKRILRKTLCVLLILVLAGASCLQSFAAGEKRYISDVEIGYGETGKQELIAQGFTVYDQNLNEDAAFNEAGNTQTTVWLGYKETTNPDEAITDMAVMNMNGGYSFSAYEAMLNKQKDEIAAMVSRYSAAISEFKEKYKAGNANAVMAYNLLNLYYEDDSKQGLGDFFVSDKTTTKQIETLFLQGNTEYLAAAQKYITIGIHDSEDTVYDRLEEAEIDDDYTKRVQSISHELLSAIKDVQAYLKAFLEVDEKYRTEQTVDGKIVPADEVFLEYLKQFTSDGAKTNTLMRGFALWNTVKDVPYADTDLTLFDVLMMSDDELWANSYYYLNPLASTFTDGQTACFSSISFDEFLLIEDYSDEELKNIYNDAMKDVPLSFSGVSVYQGIDRSMFNPEGIALTTEASKESNNDSGSSWVGGDNVNLERQKNDENFFFAMGIAFGAFAAITAGILIVKCATMVSASAWVPISAIPAVGEAVTASSQLTFSGAFASLGGVGTAAVTLIAVFAAICIACFIFYALYKNGFFSDAFVGDKDYEHSERPRVMVDSREDENGKTYYAYYYAVRDTKGGIADLNGNSSKNPQWLAMYTSKDSRLGQPISSDIKFGTSVDAPKGYSGVHNFQKGSEGVRSAFNLNYGTAKNNQSHYMFVEHVAQDAALTGSVFGEANTLIVALVAFILGGGISGAVVNALNKKKKEQVA